MVPKNAHIHTNNPDVSKSPGSGPPDSRSGTAKRPVFVIQKHESKKLHYDFHLEIGGVLKSWVVFKGFYPRPDEKRLAIPTDDHPVEYAGFEGVIPRHRYGSGTVMVWDTGTYENLMIKDGRPLPIHKCYKNGQIEVYLHGKKVTGRYILIRSERTEMEQNWLLIRVNGGEIAASSHTGAEDTSVLTGRTMNQIRQDDPESG